MDGRNVLSTYNIRMIHLKIIVTRLIRMSFKNIWLIIFLNIMLEKSFNQTFKLINNKPTIVFDTDLNVIKGHLHYDHSSKPKIKYCKKKPKN